jgi:hypothetical protein
LIQFSKNFVFSGFEKSFIKIEEMLHLLIHLNIALFCPDSLTGGTKNIFFQFAL